MDFSEFTQELINLFHIIEKIEIETIHELSSQGKLPDQGERFSQEQFDYSSIYEQLKDILMPSLDYYTYIRDNKKRQIAEKVFFVALCEMIKQDYNRGMLITFRNVTGQSEINTNRYYDLLQRVADSQELTIEKSNGRRLFEKTYILETGIPKNLTKYVTKMFKIYWRYFREMPVLDRRDEIHRYLYGDELSDVFIVDPQDANVFEDYRNYLKDFPEKAIRVFDRLDDIFTAFDEHNELISRDSYEESLEKINKRVGFDISTVLRDSELVNIYFSYLQQIPINKFIKIIHNLQKNEIVVFPDEQSKKVESISEKHICCGTYRIRGNRYDVVVDPVVSLDDIIGMRCNQIIQLAKDYFCYISRDYFEVEYDGRDIQPRKLIYKGQERTIWFGKLAAATTAYVDGNKLLSSEIYKRSIIVNKYFDYDIKESRLQIRLSSIKVNDPKYKFKKLMYSVNGEEPVLLAVGDANGKLYRDGIRIEINNSRDYFIQYFVNEDCLFEETINLKTTYLFDKWNGREYSSDSANEAHSGAFVYFSRNELNLQKCIYDITNFYIANEYYIYEFSEKSSEKQILLDGKIYQFDKAGKPSIFVYAEDGQQQYFDETEAVTLGVVNLNEDHQYTICVENNNGIYKYNAEQKIYRLSDIINETYSGKWNISLWEKQQKHDEITFTLIPKLNIIQKGVALDGNEVQVEITANEDCFLSSVGEFCNSILVNIGQAELEIQSESVISNEIEYYVYLDKYELCKTIRFCPLVWSTRVKEDETWDRKQQFAINPTRKQDVQMAILTNTNLNIYINGKERFVEPGVNLIDVLGIIGTLKNKNDIVVTDGNHSWKEIVTCNTIFKFKEITLEDNVVVVFQYNGPISENLIIRYFIDGVLEKSIYKETYKNSFLIHILIGNKHGLIGKRVSVDVRNDTVNIPTAIYDGEIIENNKLEEDTEKVADSNVTNKIKLEPLSNYIDVNQLGDIFYQKKEEKIELSYEKILEVIGGWSDETKCE